MNQKELLDQLIDACKSGDFELIKQMPLKEIDLNSCDSVYLVFASSDLIGKASLPILKYLVEQGFSVNNRTEGSYSVLESIGNMGFRNTDIAIYLVEAGAEITDYVLDCAISCDNFDFLKYLVENKKVQFTADHFITAASLGSLKNIKYLVENHNYKNYICKEAARRAGYNRDFKTLKYLMEIGIDIYEYIDGIIEVLEMYKETDMIEYLLDYKKNYKYRTRGQIFIAIKYVSPTISY